MLTHDQKWIKSETVAEAMLDLLTKEEYVGGTILEVGGSGTRVVKMVGVSTGFFFFAYIFFLGDICVHVYIRGGGAEWRMSMGMRRETNPLVFVIG